MGEWERGGAVGVRVVGKTRARDLKWVDEIRMGQVKRLTLSSC